MTFQEWFSSKPHRAKYDNDHPAYLAAQEAWQAAHEACAKACEELLSMVSTGDEHRDGVADCIAAIRARGE